MSDEEENDEFITSYVTTNVRQTFKKEMALARTRKNSIVPKPKPVPNEFQIYQSTDEKLNTTPQGELFAAKSTTFLSLPGEATNAEFPPAPSIPVKHQDFEDEPSECSVFKPLSIPNFSKKSPDKINTSHRSKLSPCPTSVSVVVDEAAQLQHVAEIDNEVMYGNFDDSDDDFLSSIPDEVLDNNAEVEQQEPYRRYNTRGSRKRTPPSPTVVDLTATPSPRRRKQRKTKRIASHPTIIGSSEVDVVVDDDDDEDSPSAMPSTREVEDDFNHEVNVKIMWKSVNLVRIPVRRLQKLEVVFEYFVKLENIPMERILLTLNGVTVKPTDTACSLNLQVCDFLEGGIVNGACSWATMDQAKPKNKANSGFSIKFQRSDKHSVTIFGSKDEKLKIFMTAYAEQTNTNINSVKFYFDGILVSSNETARGLDIENGNIIDVMT